MFFLFFDNPVIDPQIISPIVPNSFFCKYSKVTILVIGGLQIHNLAAARFLYE